MSKIKEMEGDDSSDQPAFTEHKCPFVTKGIQLHLGDWDTIDIEGAKPVKYRKIMVMENPIADENDPKWPGDWPGVPVLALTEQAAAKLKELL